nr:hypothetical protein [Methylobacterium sp. WSM2598]
MSEQRPGLSHHILPAAGSMVGVCATVIGLVKIVEERIGPSHVDEYAGVTAMLFLASALASYLSMRRTTSAVLSARLERIADLCFVLGLACLSLIAVLFAYETI